MKLKILLLLPLLCLFQSCSWLENFVITNETTENITIEYELEERLDGFPIFDTQPESYKLNSDNTIYWNEVIKTADLDTARYLVKVILPPKQGLVLGTLSNDNYKQHDQYFINGRHFNLKHLKIQTPKTTTEITAKNFDSYFTKVKGQIAYGVK
ncbi:hypothetical protein BH10BAC1_BH10BAC1_16660 [soil metagenome]